MNRKPFTILLTLVASVLFSTAGPLFFAESSASGELHRARSDQYLLDVAMEDLRRWNNRLAEKAISDLLRFHQGSILQGPALLLLARIHAREAIGKGSRHFRDPLSYFRMAENLPPFGWDRGEILFRKGQYFIRQGFGAEGRGYLEQVLSRYPNSPWAIRAKIEMADSWRARGNLKRAEKDLGEVQSRLTPLSPPQDRILVMYLRGHIQLDRGHLEKARSTFDGVLASSKEYPYAHPETLFLLARAAYAFGHDRRSATLFRQFIRLFPNNPKVGEAEYYLARISGRLGFPTHELARLREVVKDYPGALASHQAWIALLNQIFFGSHEKPAAGDLPEMLARSIAQLGRISSEERNQRVALEAELLRARLLDRAGDWKGAFREVFRLEGKVDPVSRIGKKVHHFEEHLILARIKTLSHPLQAENILSFYHSYCYRLPGPEDPGAASLYLTLSRAYRKKGDKKAAWNDLEKILSSSKDPALLAKARNQRFRWLLEDGNTQDAIKMAMDLSASSSLSRDERRKWFKLATSEAQKIKNRSLEMQIFSQWAASGVPLEHPGETLARMGLFDLGRGRHDKGRAELLQALPKIEGHEEDKSLEARVLFHLGKESFINGEREEARRYWEKMLDCCASDPRGGWVTYQLGQMALAQGNVGKARNWFQKTVDLYPNEEVARVARQRIQAMALENKDGEP